MQSEKHVSKHAFWRQLMCKGGKLRGNIQKSTIWIKKKQDSNAAFRAACTSPTADHGHLPASQPSERPAPVLLRITDIHQHRSLPNELHQSQSLLQMTDTCQQRSLSSDLHQTQGLLRITDIHQQRSLPSDLHQSCCGLRINELHQSQSLLRMTDICQPCSLPSDLHQSCCGSRTPASNVAFVMYSTGHILQERSLVRDLHQSQGLLRITDIHQQLSLSRSYQVK
ncbi:uncharacterized protein LOC121721026 [Alosa sapidissima]|uniref:uncharacterized protein LOC121721026 n=1 Tax=Alosa sapidissima TaxID=34773 RepID=UPI001C0A08C1|nr:uncharacterized protein LOC121721026 [Alosa sapidissima]